MIGIPYSLIGIGVAASLAVGYFLYSQSKIEQLKEQNTQLIEVNLSNQEAINRLEKNIANIYELNSELRKGLSESEAYRNELSKKLSNHDLTRLSHEKPGLIEKRINDATQKKFTDMEEYTRNLSVSNSD